MWTTERPTEAGNYYYGHKPPEMVNAVRLFEQSGDWFVMYLEDGLTLPVTHACGYWGPRIPSPDRLAALERLAEAATRYTRANDKFGEADNETWDSISREICDAESHLQDVAVEFVRDIDALDAVREAK